MKGPSNNALLSLDLEDHLCIYIYIYDSDIVLNIVIPPLVTSCKILLIIVNFLAALAARKRCDFRLLLHLSNSIFWGFPLSQVSVVLLSANNVVNTFFCFVLSPIVAVAKTQLFRPTLSKPGYDSNILVIFFNSVPPYSHDIYQLPCNSYILRTGQRTPTNNLYTCIYYNKHRAISTKN